MLRVRIRRRPSEPDPVSTGEGSPMKPVRRASPSSAVALAPPSTACIAGGEGRPPTRETPAAAAPRRPGHPRLVLRCPKKLVRQFEDETGYDLEVRGVRRRRHADQQARAHQGQPDRRRGVRRRQHLRLARARRGVFAVRRRRCRPVPTSTRCRATTADRLDPSTTATCASTSTHLVRRAGIEPPETLDDLTDPAYRGPLRDPGGAPARPGWPSCWPPSRSTATTGRTTGAT